MIHHAIYALSCFDKLDTDLDNLAFHLYNPDSYEQWGVTTCADAEANITSIGTATYPIAFSKSAVHISTSLENAGYSSEWTNVSTWHGKATITNAVLYLVANKKRTSPQVGWLVIGR